MYTFVSTYRTKEGKLEELKGHLDDVGKRVGEIDGAVHLQVCWNDDGEGAVIARYRDAASVEAGQEAVQAVWGSVMHLLDGPPQRSGFAHGRSWDY